MLFLPSFPDRDEAEDLKRRRVQGDLDWVWLHASQDRLVGPVQVDGEFLWTGSLKFSTLVPFDVHDTDQT